MKKAERKLAEEYLLKCILEEDPDFVDHTMEKFGVSRSTVYNYINTLQKNGELERVGGSMPYRIVYRTTRITIDTSKEHSEDRTYHRDIAPLLSELPQNVQTIWRYAITAMLNNAMEHARASAIVCVVNRSRLCTMVGVLDNGVGIFRNIMQQVKAIEGDAPTQAEAASLLHVGGYTGAPETHLGQGIFFTSRLMDHFAIRSDTYLFTPHAEEEEEVAESDRFRGTAVQMALANDSEKQLSEVMARYIDPELGFVRTEIPVRKMFAGTFPLSRSEARRLATLFSKFRVVELNFEGVEDIGPDFAHELFGVIAKSSENLTLTVVGENEKVAAAIRRATK